MTRRSVLCVLLGHRWQYLANSWIAGDYHNYLRACRRCHRLDDRWTRTPMTRRCGHQQTRQGD